MDLKRPKNLFKEVASGSYYLSAELIVNVNWEKRDPRFKKTIESNKLVVTVESEKKQ